MSSSSNPPFFCDVCLAHSDIHHFWTSVNHLLMYQKKFVFLLFTSFENMELSAIVKYAVRTLSQQGFITSSFFTWLFLRKQSRKEFIIESVLVGHCCYKLIQVKIFFFSYQRVWEKPRKYWLNFSLRDTKVYLQCHKTWSSV